MFNFINRTICAISTPVGKSAIGVIRISGHLVCNILWNLLGFCPANRVATLCTIKNKRKKILLDQCIVVFYKYPNSYTGDDLVEFYCHGNKVILFSLLDSILFFGCTLALPGEFSFRAFLNKKINFFQVKTILKLLSLDNISEISNFINFFKDQFKFIFVKYIYIIYSSFLTKYEFYYEFNVKFLYNKDEIFLFYYQLLFFFFNNLLNLLKKKNFKKICIEFFFIGQPNVGKSSLLNSFCKKNTSIVSIFPGTTRDFIKCKMKINDKVFYLIDAVGIKLDQCDRIEKIGLLKLNKLFRRSKCTKKFIILFDISNPWTFFSNRFLSNVFFCFNNSFLFIINKIDIFFYFSFSYTTSFGIFIFLSAKQKNAMLLLMKYFKSFFINKKFKQVQIFIGDLILKLFEIKILLMKSYYFFLKKYYIKSLKLFNLSFNKFNLIFYIDSKILMKNIFSSFCIGK